MSPSLQETSPTPETWMESNLLRKLHDNAGTTAIITSTDRAARTLRQRYNQQRHVAGESGWMTPQILAWKPWMTTLWEAGILHGLEKRLVLTDFQELEIWRSILANDAAAQQTISPDKLASAAQKTWQQMQQYQIALKRLQHDSTLDTTTFHKWAVAFENLCKQSFFLSFSQLEVAIARWILSSEISLPTEIFLIGFDRVNPSQILLIDTLRQRGITVQFVESIPPGNQNREKTIICARTVDKEIEAAAYWARERLLHDPKQKIGILVPSLEKLRSSIDTVFSTILVPSSMDIRSPQGKLPYEFSLGTPMHRMQPIRTVIMILRWLNQPLSAEDFSWLLVHGCFDKGFDTSRNTRALLDRKFRERKFQMGGAVPFSTFRRWLSQLENFADIGPFHQTIENISLTAKRAAMDKPRPFAEWHEIIEQILETAHWQLLSAETSADYQLLQRWNSVLRDFSSLNTVSGAVSFSTALDRLEDLISQTLFALQTNNASVLIVGIPESAGLVFDAVWWMNAQASTWPQRGKALPFLPWKLQHEAHMPYANSTEDYVFASRITNRILASADVVTVSFSLQENDVGNATTHLTDREILLTRLVRAIWPDVPIVEAEHFSNKNAHTPEIQKFSRNSSLESIDKELPIPFQGSAIRGGVDFLKLQAACPFRAFAELRLGTRPLENPGNGISIRDQGNVIHTVLEKFWKEVQTQTNLLKLSPSEYRTTLRKYIDEALRGFALHAQEPWQKTLLSIEADRLEERLTEWLEIEKRRPEFTVISTETELKNPQLGDIAFRCRVDRIDRVEQGIALIDYKTGRVNRNSCEGDRPDEPQLPAYAVLREQSANADDPLAGLAFVGLHPEKTGFTVINSLRSVFEPNENNALRSGEEIPGRKSRTTSRGNSSKLTPQQMSDLEIAWRETLTRLAQAFQAGLAVVDPKKHAETCTYCEQSLLCRIQETNTSSMEIEEYSSDISDSGIES